MSKPIRVSDETAQVFKDTDNDKNLVAFESLDDLVEDLES